MAILKLDYPSIRPLLPVENVDDVGRWRRFISLGNEEIIVSLMAKVFVTEELDIVVHKSFINAMKEVDSRGALRGHDYVIFAQLGDDGWYLHARIDRHFISEEDVINE